MVSFNFPVGSAFARALIVDANGDLFGTTEFGGADGYGNVLEIVNTGAVAAPIYASAPTTLVSFNGINGLDPSRLSLIADANGDLFGTTYFGGTYGQGNVFEIVNTGAVAAPSYASTPVTLVSFNGSNGNGPVALIADAKGDLFGTTAGGGANGDGTVFEIVNTGTVATPSYASTPTTLVSFNGINGSGPTSGLIADANGDLFGATGEGGAYGDGTVFEIVNTGAAAAPSYASTPVTLVSFNGSNGNEPVGALIADANGDLFGTTVAGGAYGDGTVFEIVNTGAAAAPSYASAPVTLASFNGTNGSEPVGALIADANGDLFGTTSFGGTYGQGNVFEIVNNGAAAAPNYASTPTTLVSFNSSNGYEPVALVADANGDLFGTTSVGGMYGEGNVFEITDSGFVPLAIMDAIANQLVSDSATIDPFEDVTVVADVTVGQTETVTVTPSNAATGTLSDPNAASDGSAITNGVYTVTGTAAAVTEDLDGLVFTPTDHQLALDTIQTVGFTIAATDTAGQTASDSTTSVVIFSSSGLPGGILWQDISGQASIWEVSGNTRIGGGAVSVNPGPAWKAVGTGAFFSGDISDILWQNTSTGQVSVWEMDGNTRTGGGLVGLDPGPTWTAVGT
ncbi:MAG TPA: choice-of-anchor tandem repeat GloVer-containing protein, partial [Candidatus Methylacidiphilales bacterium]|nr:choice-of-anchor tandem repeat GloVer-containing protein [Candidatus Methylacidiphilales bacterium]